LNYFPEVNFASLAMTSKGAVFFHTEMLQQANASLPGSLYLFDEVTLKT